MTALMALEQRTVPNLLRNAAKLKGDRTFLHFEGRSWTFGEVAQKANRFAALLGKLGVEPGGRVAILLYNSPEWLFVWLGCSMANVAYVPINTEYLGDILAYQLAKAEVSAVVIGDTFVDRIAQIEDRLTKPQTLIVVGDVAAAAKVKTARSISYQEADKCSDADPNIPVAHSDAHAISFTSGTTGPSKGVLASNAHAVTFALDTVRALALKDGEKIYNTGMPMFHSLATWMGVLPALATCSEYMMLRRFSASNFWPDVHAFGATVALGVFTIPPVLLKQPPRDDDAQVPLSRFIVTQHNKDFEKRFNGCRLMNVYGQTETGVVTMVPYGEEPRQGSCGKVNKETFEVRVVDDNDNECPPGVAGEILVRPRLPYVMMTEYFNMPVETIKAFRNLWFHTGDAGKFDEDGYLYFTDRKKDAMRRRGENISSFEIEAVINRHPKVLECAVVAVPSPFGEDDLKAVVVLKPDEAALTHEELWTFFEENMPRFWVPRYIEFRAELPKTPNQKILKYVIRDQGVIGDCKDRELKLAPVQGSV